MLVPNVLCTNSGMNLLAMEAIFVVVHLFNSKHHRQFFGNYSEIAFLIVIPKLI